MGTAQPEVRRTLVGRSMGMNITAQIGAHWKKLKCTRNILEGGGSAWTLHTAHRGKAD